MRAATRSEAGNDLAVRRIRVIFAALLLLLAWVALGAWLFVQVVTDRWLWSQYAYWAPTMWVLGTVTGLLVLRAGLRTRRAWDGRRIKRSISGIAAWLLAIAAWGWWLVLDQHALRPTRHAPNDALRILFWNVATSGGRDWPESVPASESDVVIIANPDRFDGIDQVIAAMPDTAPRVRAFPFSVVSRVPIIRFGWSDLQIVPLPEGPDDRGSAMWLELDTTERFGRPIVVWVLDLPSDIRMHRRGVAAAVAETLRAHEGVISYGDPKGGAESATQRTRGFPPADVIVGDFNIPRGSGSLELLAPDMEGAYSQAGKWGGATYQSPRAWWAIDQVFLRSPLRAAEYRVIDPVKGNHRMVQAAVVNEP